MTEGWYEGGSMDLWAMSLSNTGIPPRRTNQLVTVGDSFQHHVSSNILHNTTCKPSSGTSMQEQ